MAAVTGYTSALDDSLGDITGALEDWNYAAQGAFGYTIELGPAGSSQFEGPFATHVVDQYAGIHEALLLAGEEAADRTDHLVVTGRAPAGRTLLLTKSFDTRTSPICGDDACLATSPALALPDGLSMSMKVPSSGRFTWDVGPSTRPWVAKAGGREAWTLTCSASGRTLATHAIVAGRGRTATVEPCVTGSRVRVAASSTFALGVTDSTRATLLARGVLVRVRCGRRCTVATTVSLGGRRVAARTASVAAGRTTALRVRPASASAAAIRSSSVRIVTVRVRATDDADAIGTASRSWRLLARR